MVLISNNSINRLLIEENYKEFIESLDQNPDFAIFCYNIGYSILNASVSNKDSISEALSTNPNSLLKKIIKNQGLSIEDFHNSQNIILLPELSRIVGNISTTFPGQNNKILAIHSPIRKTTKDFNSNPNLIFTIQIDIQNYKQYTGIFRLIVSMLAGASTLASLATSFKLGTIDISNISDGLSLIQTGFEIYDNVGNKNIKDINAYMDKILYNFNRLSNNKFIYAFDIDGVEHSTQDKITSIYLGIYAFYNSETFKRYNPNNNNLFKIKNKK